MFNYYNVAKEINPMRNAVKRAEQVNVHNFVLLKIQVFTILYILHIHPFCSILTIYKGFKRVHH
jgi:hypothetical protein